MSLDVYLELEPAASNQVALDLLRQNNLNDEADILERALARNRTEYAYDANITHNLGKMAKEAGIYEACWHPDRINVTHAYQLIPLLSAGIELMKSDPVRFKAFDADNGWGTYVQFLPWLEKYLAACKEYPSAKVTTSPYSILYWKPSST